LSPRSVRAKGSHSRTDLSSNSFFIDLNLSVGLQGRG
jgi:hypothetical protein